MAYGIPGVRVNGNNLLAVYAHAREAVGRARRRDGPTLLGVVKQLLPQAKRTIFWSLSEGLVI